MKILTSPFNTNISFLAHMSRHLGQGARYLGSDTTRFRVSAPLAQSVDVFVSNADNPDDTKKYSLEKNGDTFESTIKGVGAGDRYQYEIKSKDGQIHRTYDPRADYLPNDIGQFKKNSDWAEVIDHESFIWEDEDWMKKRRAERKSLESWQLPENMVTEDIHIGLLGGFKEAKKEIDKIAQNQIANTVRIMPIGEFYGDMNWGYDEVAKFAVENTYGTPDDFKDFVNHAHKNGIRVILDVVPNHFGPYGNIIDKYVPIYSKTKQSPWGGNILEFNGDAGKYARSYITDMLMNWAVNYHVDGFRMDATQQMDSDNGLRQIMSQLRLHKETKDLILYPEDIRISRALANSKMPKKVTEYNFGFDGMTTFEFYKAMGAMATKQQIHDFSPNAWRLEQTYRAASSWTNEDSCVNNENIDPSFREYCKKLITKPQISANNIIVDISNQDEIGNDAGGKRNILNILFSRLNLNSRCNGDWRKAQRLIFDMVKSYAQTGKCLNEDVQRKDYGCKKPVTNKEFENELKTSFELSKVMLGGLFMHAGAKEFFMGEDRGELAPFKYFCNMPQNATNPFTKQRYIDQIAEEKGYRTDKTAFMESRIGQEEYQIRYIQEGTTAFSKDLKAAIQNSPALKHKSFDNLVTYSYPDKELVEVKYYDNSGNETIAVLNFSPNAYRNFRLNTTNGIELKEIINSSDKKYGGNGKNANNGTVNSNNVTINANSIVIFEKISQ